MSCARIWFFASVSAMRHKLVCITLGKIIYSPDQQYERREIPALSSISNRSIYFSRKLCSRGIVHYHVTALIFPFPISLLEATIFRNGISLPCLSSALDENPCNVSSDGRVWGSSLRRRDRPSVLRCGRLCQSCACGMHLWRTSL